MGFNNRWSGAVFVLLSILVVVRVCGTSTHSKAKVMEEIGGIQLQDMKGRWIVHLQIAHHKLQLGVKVATCRSWIKDSQCKVCGRIGSECSSQKICISSNKDPNITCDSAFCSKDGAFVDETQGIQGIETQIFCKIGKGTPTLMPIVMARQITHPIPQMGELCLLDPESSFSKGLIIQREGEIQIVNLKVRPEQLKTVIEQSLRVAQFKTNKNGLDFDQGTAIHINNQNSQLYRSINLASKHFRAQLSLEQSGVVVPKALFKQIEKQITEVYFSSNSCHFSLGKLKCREQIGLGGLTSAILQFQFSNKTVLSLPLQLLLGGCTNRQCKFMITSHHRTDVVIIGSAIWETVSLAWDIKKGTVNIYTLNNQWGSVYSDFNSDLSHQSFLGRLIAFVLYIFKYLLILLFGLAAISLCINLIIRWKDLLRFIRGVLTRMKQKRGRPLTQNQQEEDFAVDTLPSLGRDRRRAQRLPDELQDQL